MYNLSAILIIILILSQIFNYLSFRYYKTAVQLVNDMGIGYNLGNTFNFINIINNYNLENEEINLLGTTLPTKNVLKGIKKSGFKTIRFQILYNNNTYNNEGKINSEWIQKVKELINLVSNLNLYLILSIQHSNQFFITEGKKSKDKYINFWRDIANEFNNYDEHLIFESMYEIGYLVYLNKKDNYFEDKDYYLSQDFINIIRDSGGLNIKRLLIVPLISSDYELSFFNVEYTEYKVPKDPYNRIAILIYYFFPSEEFSLYNTLEPVNLYDNEGNSISAYPQKEWGSSRNYKDIVSNFKNMKTIFTDKGIPVIIGEIGILNDYIIKNNNIEQLLYTIFSMSYEYEGILPCLWDIPVTSSIHEKFYYNKESNQWSNWKYQNIFNKISKGNFIKSLNYFSQSNLETEDYNLNGALTIFPYHKKIVKIFVNLRIKIHIGENDFFASVFSISKIADQYSVEMFHLYEKDGKRHYDGTSIFTIDAPEGGLHLYAQLNMWYGERYVIANNITAQYEESYSCFDHSSYKSDILKEINYESD